MSFLINTWETGATACRTKRFSLTHWLKQWRVRRGATSFQNRVSVAILCTDIVSFSQRLAHPLPEGEAEAVRTIIAHYYPLLNKTVRCYGGRINNMMGDGMLAIFSSVDQAARAALDLRRAVSAFNQARRAEWLSPFPTRLVVHYGQVYVANCSWRPFAPPTYLGETVNTASHLANLVPPERVFISANALASLSDQPESRLWQTVPIKGTPRLLDIYEIAACSWNFQALPIH